MALLFLPEMVNVTLLGFLHNIAHILHVIFPVVHVEIVDVGEDHFKSPCMEKIVYQHALETLLKLMKVKEVVTDPLHTRQSLN